MPLSLPTYMCMVGHVNMRMGTHTHKLYGWPIRTQAAHTHMHMSCLYAYGTAHTRMRQPIRIWAKYLYGTEYSYNCMNT